MLLKNARFASFVVLFVILIFYFVMLASSKTLTNKTDLEITAAQFLQRYRWMLQEQSPASESSVGLEAMPNQEILNRGYRKKREKVKSNPVQPWENHNGIKWARQDAAIEIGFTPFEQQINESIERGLQWLRDTQNGDGSWSTYEGCKVGETGLAVVAFLEKGVEESGPTVSKAISYLLKTQLEDGSWSKCRQTYETSCAILALALTGNEEYKDEIEKGVNALVQAQRKNPNCWCYGGWRYDVGDDGTADLSNTQFALLALDIGGLPKEDEVWQRAEQFVSRCQNTDGGLAYQPGSGSSGSMTGSGLWCLRLCGIPTTDGRIQNALDWFRAHFAYNTNPNKGDWLYYYLWSAAKPFHLTTPDSESIGGLRNPEGDGYPEESANWYYDFAYHLVNTQNADGSWNGSSGRVACTSFALQVLQKAIPRKYAVLADISPKSVTVQCRQTATFTVTLENKGVEMDSYDIEVSGLPKGFRWNMERNVEHLPGGESLNLPLTINLSVPPCCREAKYQFSVSAISKSAPEESNSTASAEIIAVIVPQLILIPDRQTTGPRDAVVVHVFAQNAQGIAGGDIVVTYDKDLLDLIETKPGDFSEMRYTKNHNIPGEISLGIAMSEAISEVSGSLVDLVFKVHEDVSDQETIFAFKEAEIYSVLGETIPTLTQDGSMTIRVRSCVKGDVNYDGHINVVDVLLALRIVVGLITPTPEQTCAADVNSDGKVRSNDAILIFNEAVGLAAPELMIPLPSQETSTLTIEAETQLLDKIIAELENASLTPEQKHVLEQLKPLIGWQPLPSHTTLLQNYPNPFNPETWIPFNLAQDMPVIISIYNANGQRIRTITLGNKKAGRYITRDKAAYWDGQNSFGQKVTSGVYYYTIQAGEFAATRKMVILK